MNNYFKSVILIAIISSSVFSQIKSLDNLVSENLVISMPYDSLVSQNNFTITDQRKFEANILGITQINKYKFIPVDQHLVLNHDLVDYLSYKLLRDSVSLNHKLIIKNLTLWEDREPIFNRAKVLSGYSCLLDEKGQRIKDWQWSIRHKDKKTLESEENIANIFDQWLCNQTDSLKHLKFNTDIYPYKFRRVLESWFDFILLPDGFIINGNLTLNFPRNHKNTWFLGSGGMYYRRSFYHESFSIGGFDQHWYKRLSPALVWRNNTALRIGINSFNRDEFDHVDYWNIMMVNLGFSSSLEYRPKVFRGFFFGGGAYLNVNGLPYIPAKIKIIEPGIFTTIGISLP